MNESSAITAPVRLDGQGNSDVLFNWLTVNQYLWMLAPPDDEQLERIVDPQTRLHLGFKLIKWRRDPNHGEAHPAIAVPKNEESREAAFRRLEILIKNHFLDSGDTKRG